MDDKKIFKKAMDKSIKGGWDLRYPPTISNRLMNYKRYYRYIFDLGFAKGLWGKEEICSCCGNEFTTTREMGGRTFDFDLFECECGTQSQPTTRIACQFHVQQMSLEEEPLEYIAKFL